MQSIIIRTKEKTEKNPSIRKGYLISFLAPIIIMMIYFIAIGAYPFGKNTIMTVDLGQQYIDFFGLFHDTILHHPSSFFYSFSKDLGGDMLGVWSYYLLSPLNFIFLFFNKTNLDVAVIILTLIKYGLAGITFYFWGVKTTKNSVLFLIAASISYAISGFFICNQFNIMWIDAAYFTPLVAWGIFLIFHQKHTNFYSFALAGMLITNYYMGYMICIFAVLYFIYLATLNYHTLKDLLKQTTKFIFSSVRAAAIAAFVLLPTFFQLTQSKGTYTIRIIHWRFEYAPFKMLTKFNIGAFNFDAVSSGLPNLFIPSFILAFAILFFTIKKIALRIRFAALLISIFFFLSLCFEPLDLFWHGLQFPVWYPYRFSYLAIFWLFVLALKAFEYVNELRLKHLIIPGALFAAIVYISIFEQKHLNYLSYPKIILTTIFLILTIANIGGIINQYPFFKNYFPYLIIFEAIVNAYVSLNMIGFISHTDFSQYVQTAGKEIKKIKKDDQKFYRIGKSFERTNNDAMLLDFNGTDQFNSMLEPKITSLYAKLGQPQSEGDVIYGNGNIFTDSILGIKYFLEVNPNSNREIYKPIGTRGDIQNYGTKNQNRNVIVKENPYALETGFLIPKEALKPDLALVNPISNYNTIYHHLSNRNKFDDLFIPFYGYSEKLINLKKKTSASWNTYTKIDSKKKAKIVISFRPYTNDPYYVSLNGSLTDNKINYSVNGKTLQQNDTIQNTIVQSICQNQKNNEVKYVLTLNTKEIDIYDFSFYTMDSKRFLVQNAELQRKQLKVLDHHSNGLKGKIEVDEENQILFFNIPFAKGWQARIDGKNTKVKKAFHNFIAIPLKTGKHVVEIEYIPPYFKVGVMISLITIVGYLFRIIIRIKLKLT